MTDEVHKWTRTKKEYKTNDDTRKLFKTAIVNMFGGESKIPESVKKAMLLSDYDSGSPLTARRILTVKAAIDADGTAKARSAILVLETFSPEVKAAARALGYFPKELPRLARAAHLYAQATGLNEMDAMHAVAEPGSKANRLNFRNPVHPAFPKPANAEALPKNAAERRAFLVSVMEEYRQKELGPEKGRAFHGRGHIVRAFIYATAMANILKEQGVEVDFNAVLCGIAGHDLARARPGKDHWEAQSGEMTVAAMNNAYGPNALGGSYAQEIVDSIIGVEVKYPDGFKTSVPKSPTLEAHILQSADSLDIGRVQTFDPRQFAFLQYGAKEMPENIAKLRDQLAKEADLLQRLTNPLCANRDTRTRLDNVALMSNGQEGRQAAAQSAKLLHDGEEQLMAQAHDDNNEAFVANVESFVRDNPKLFPVLSKYYIG